MIQCKILHINDGRPRELSNGNFLYHEDFPRTEKILNEHLADGWVMKAMVPQYTPGHGDGGYPFYLSGYAFYLEREVDQLPEEDEPEEELWPGLNEDALILAEEDEEDEDFFDE